MQFWSAHYSNQKLHTNVPTTVLLSFVIIPILYLKLVSIIRQVKKLLPGLSSAEQPMLPSDHVWPSSLIMST